MDVFLIKKFYEGLDRGEKGKFLLWLQATLEISQSTAITRINSDHHYTTGGQAVRSVPRGSGLKRSAHIFYDFNLEKI